MTTPSGKLIKRLGDIRARGSARSITGRPNEPKVMRAGHVFCPMNKRCRARCIEHLVVVNPINNRRIGKAWIANRRDLSGRQNPDHRWAELVRAEDRHIASRPMSLERRDRLCGLAALRM